MVNKTKKKRLPRKQKKKLKFKKAFEKSQNAFFSGLGDPMKPMLERNRKLPLATLLFGTT